MRRTRSTLALVMAGAAVTLSACTAGAPAATTTPTPVVRTATVSAKPTTSSASPTAKVGIYTWTVGKSGCQYFGGGENCHEVNLTLSGWNARATVVCTAKGVGAPDWVAIFTVDDTGAWGPAPAKGESGQAIIGNVPVADFGTCATR